MKPLRVWWQSEEKESPVRKRKDFAALSRKSCWPFLCSKSLTYKSCKRDCHFFITDKFNTSTKQLQSLSGLEKRKWDKNDKRKTAVFFLGLWSLQLLQGYNYLLQLCGDYITSFLLLKGYWLLSKWQNLYMHVNNIIKNLDYSKS